MADITEKKLSEKSDIINQQDGKASKATVRDIDLEKLCDYIWQEYNDRKNRRTEREKSWREIDRQLRMEPDISFKTAANGKPDVNKAWMPELELPLRS